MYYEVYIDQLFLEILIILVILQKIGGKLMNRSLSAAKIWLAALTGSGTVCTAVFFRITGNRPAAALLLCLCAVIMAVVGLGCRSWRETGASMVYLLSAGAFFGGICRMIFSLWKTPVAAAAVPGYLAADCLIRRLRERMGLEEYRAKVILEDQGDRWELTGLIDTGNRLKEPLTGRPVSILEEKEAVKMQRYCRIQQEKNGYLLIPYYSVGTEKGWMQGMVVDAMYIRYRGENVRITHPVLAVCKQQLSRKGQYQMILNPMQIKTG